MRTGLEISSGSDVSSPEVQGTEGRSCRGDGNRGGSRTFDDEETVGSFGPGASRPWNFGSDRGPWEVRLEAPWEPGRSCRGIARGLESEIRTGAGGLVPQGERCRLS